MSRGKYSPTVRVKDHGEYRFNCLGQEPAPWNPSNWNTGPLFDEQTMFSNYDSEGYDSYGYSAFDGEGKYVGPGNGVDRNGITEHEYLCMSDDEFSQYL